MEKNVVITGARGVIGRVVQSRLRGLSLSEMDLPEHDLNDIDVLDAILPNHHAVVHLAWNSKTENYKSETFDPANAKIANNVLARSLAHGVRRVILASSVHVDSYPPPPGIRLIKPNSICYPDSLYGANKVFIEAMGRYYSTKGLEVIAIRFGGVNSEDRQPTQDASERAVWLSHRDCANLIQRCIDAQRVLKNFCCLYAVSDNVGRWHDVKNPFKWVPEDGDREPFEQPS